LTNAFGILLQLDESSVRNRASQYILEPRRGASGWSGILPSPRNKGGIQFNPHGLLTRVSSVTVIHGLPPADPLVASMRGREERAAEHLQAVCHKAASVHPRMTHSRCCRREMLGRFQGFLDTSGDARDCSHLSPFELSQNFSADGNGATVLVHSAHPASFVIGHWTRAYRKETFNGQHAHHTRT
jgi:hypothetical protein